RLLLGDFLGFVFRLFLDFLLGLFARAAPPCELDGAAFTLERAIHEVHVAERAAETVRSGFDEVEARLERQALETRANLVSQDVECVARQPQIMRNALAGHADGAGGGPVTLDAPGAIGSVEALIGEKAADDEFSRHVRRHDFLRERGRAREQKRRDEDVFLAKHRSGGQRLHFVTCAKKTRSCQARINPCYSAIRTTIRPRTLPARIEGAVSITLPRPISVVMAASFLRSRSSASRFHACRRHSMGHITDSMPKSETPRRMNGATEEGRSIPCARPQAAIAPPYLVMEMTFASVAEPTLSMPAPQRSLPSGFAGAESSARSRISAAPSDFR